VLVLQSPTIHVADDRPGHDDGVAPSATPSSSPGGGGVARMSSL
jgi:hypothetical protein